MHELSIALSILDELEEQVAQHGGAAVEVIYLRIGALSGVDMHALRSAWELAAESTPFAFSRLEIEPVALLVFCPQCGVTHTPDSQHIACPRCISPEQKIIEGRELEVRALELAT
jgi:hydrogenase nickel incorporation protein HypA/HybF